MGHNNTKYHIIALLTIVVWGTTFISTKLLLQEGLKPSDIMFYRFLIAYVVMFAVSPKIKFAKNLKDELIFVAMGICGGSLYFLTENMALEITLASNVSLLISTAPLFTALITRLIYRDQRISNQFVMGSVIALLGVAFVVFNGGFVLKISPLGDVLTLIAALTWAFYTILFKLTDDRYTVMFITRKVFFYGVVTLLPVFFVQPLHHDLALLSRPMVWGNLLFLGVVASLVCYIAWNVSVKHLGSVRTNNYIYLNPLITLIFAAMILGEKITPIAILGAIFILLGLYVAERGFKLLK